MKKFYILISVFIVALLVGSCTKDEKGISNTEDFAVFEASFADSQTKTYVGENLKLLWHSEDQISIFYTTLNKKYQFNGKTGENSGTFTDLMAEQFGTGNPTSANYAVYPYMQSTQLGNDEVLTVTLPKEQEYMENSFGRGANTMVAVTDGLEDKFLPFKNVCGFLKLKLYGENVTVKSIVLKGNAEENIAGEAKIVAKYNTDPTITALDNPEKIITLNCGNQGVKLGSTAEDAVDFWFVVPPVKFDNGFTVSIVDIYGNIMQKSTTKSFEVERNTLKSMEAFKVEIDAENYSNQITYTTTDNAILAIDESKFEAKILSHKYENGIGKIVFDEQLKNIADETFRLKTTLKSIKLPEGITHIGDNVFESCIKLADITIPSSVRTFGMEVFKGCVNLISVFIPGGVTIIGNRAFYGCSSLTSVIIPDGVTSINDGTFQGCSSLTSVIIPDGLTSILYNAFQGCSSLTSVIIPDGVTSIGFDAFYGCSSLTSVIIPDGVTSIKSDTFYGCSSLTSVIIPDGVSTIYERAFAYCTSLERIEIPKGVTEIFTDTFYGCSSLTSVIIPDGVTSIGFEAFEHCSSLTRIEIPKSVITIGGQAFYGCSLLTDIVIPDGVISIGEYAFSNCSMLVSVTLPKNITKINEYTFYGCKNLANVVSNATTAPILGENAFFTYGEGSLTLKVPKGSKESYENSAWKDWFLTIVEME